MPEETPTAILLDQNVPILALGWLREQMPGTPVYHASNERLQKATDRELCEWLQKHHAALITLDETFGKHFLNDKKSDTIIIRLAAQPPTPKAILSELDYLFQDRPQAVPDDDELIKILRHDWGCLSTNQLIRQHGRDKVVAAARRVYLLPDTYFIEKAPVKEQRGRYCRFIIVNE
jgi:predicted nuclease of predicted toxin-antitoxin system